MLVKLYVSVTPAVLNCTLWYMLLLEIS